MKTIHNFDDLIQIFTELKAAGALLQKADLQLNTSSTAHVTDYWLTLDLSGVVPHLERIKAIPSDSHSAKGN